MSRTRSPMTSRSNWAKDSSTLRVSRPMLLVVLKDWVTETNETAWLVEQFDQLGKIGQRPGQPVDLVDDDDVDLAGATSASSFCRAGRSSEAPEKAPSS